MRGGAGKSEDASRVCLEEIVELLLAQIAANGKVVAAAIDTGGSGKAIGTVTIERALLVNERGNAAGEGERRRSPVGRVLVVAGNAGIARNILPVFKIRNDVGSEPAEVIAAV